MGVPITFLGSYNPDQFEIIGLTHGLLGQEVGVSDNLTEEEFKALKKENKDWRKGDVCYRDSTTNKLVICYQKLLIRRKGELIDG